MEESAKEKSAKTTTSTGQQTDPNDQIDNMEPELLDEIARLSTTVKEVNKETFERMTVIHHPVPESKNKVYLTGFGQFNGVDVNPTQLLIEKLQEKTRRQTDESTDDSEYDDVICEVLPVAVDKVDNFHENLPDDGMCFIHLGVNGQGTSIQLEKVAYNNMDFRCADESGYTPQKTPIASDEDLDTPLKSMLPLDDIAKDLAKEGFNCTVSEDPGRFLCNYVYYRSLQKQKNSVFIHVPHLTVVDLDTQLECVKKAVKKIYVYTRLCNAAFGEIKEEDPTLLSWEARNCIVKKFISQMSSEQRDHSGPWKYM